MKVEFTILEKSGQHCIKINKKGIEHNLWDGIIKHCSKSYSPRQLVDIYKQLCIQLSKMDKDNIPYCYFEMFKEFKEGIENLGVKI